LLPLPLLLSPPSLFPYTTLFRSAQGAAPRVRQRPGLPPPLRARGGDRAAPRPPDGHQGAPPAREEPPLPGHGVRRRRVAARAARSEEHTSELQSRVDLVCRLLLE